MIDRCANPACNEPLVYLRSGALYAVEAPELAQAGAATRFFWMCESCSREFTLRATGDAEPSVERTRDGLANPEWNSFPSRIRRIPIGRRSEKPPALIVMSRPEAVAPCAASTRVAPASENRTAAFERMRHIGMGA